MAIDPVFDNSLTYADNLVAEVERLREVAEEERKIADESFLYYSALDVAYKKYLQSVYDSFTADKKKILTDNGFTFVDAVTFDALETNLGNLSTAHGANRDKLFNRNTGYRNQISANITQIRSRARVATIADTLFILAEYTTVTKNELVESADGNIATMARNFLISENKRINIVLQIVKDRERNALTAENNLAIVEIRLEQVKGRQKVAAIEWPKLKALFERDDDD